MLGLARGGWEAELLPELGGALTRLTRNGADILRPTPADAAHPFETACFPLVPYANRIADGRFAFAGEQHAVPRNCPDQAHPLHGVGWLRAWEVTHATPDEAVLVHRYAGGTDWPWAYVAEQRVALSETGLRVTLAITNADVRPMPVSLGLHPYFAKEGVTSLRFASDGVWRIDAAFLPTEPARADLFGDWSEGQGLERGALIDNSFSGWSGEALLTRDEGAIRLTGEGTPFLHLYLPPGQPFFCAEPVSAMPDALNRAEPHVLAPGERATVAMEIAAA